MQLLDSQKLAAGALEHAFFTSCGLAVLGNADGPFALHDEGENSLILMRTDDTNHAHVSFEKNFSTYPLQIALEHSANFTVENGVVTCVIGTIAKTGASYIEAAMRAVISVRRSFDEQSRATRE